MGMNFESNFPNKKSITYPLRDRKRFFGGANWIYPKGHKLRILPNPSQYINTTHPFGIGSIYMVELIGFTLKGMNFESNFPNKKSITYPLRDRKRFFGGANWIRTSGLYDVNVAL